MGRTSVLRLLEETTAATLDQAGRCFDRGPMAETTVLGWKVVKREINLLAQRVRAMGGTPVFVYLPRPDEMKPATKAFDPRAPARRFEEMVHSANAAWIDLSPDFLAARAAGRGDLHLPVDTHLTADGHQVVAEGLARALRALLEGK